MNYDYYKTFIVLAQTKNFSRTAKKINVAQSTVSNRIKELEKYLGYILLTRQNKTVELTLAGEEFLPYAKRIIAIESEAVSKLGNTKYKHSINIGTVHSSYQGYVKNKLKDFIKFNNDVSIRVLINHSNQLLEYLVDELIDIAIVSYVPNSSKYLTVSTLNDEIILVAKNTTKFKKYMNLVDLRNAELICTDLGDSFDLWIKDHLKNQVNHQIYIDQINEVLEFLLEGFGYAFILKSVAQKYIDEGALKQVNVDTLPHYFIEHFIVVNKHKYENPKTKAFLKALEKK